MALTLTAQPTPITIAEMRAMLSKTTIFKMMAAGGYTAAKAMQQAAIPPLTTAQRDALTAGQKFVGMQIYNTTTSLPNWWDGTAWKAPTLA